MRKQPQSFQDSLSWKQLLKRIALGSAVIVTFFGVLFLVNSWYLIIRTHPEPQTSVGKSEPGPSVPQPAEKCAPEPGSTSSQEDLTFFRSLTETKESDVPLPQETPSSRSTRSSAAIEPACPIIQTRPTRSPDSPVCCSDRSLQESGQRRTGAGTPETRRAEYHSGENDPC